MCPTTERVNAQVCRLSVMGPVLQQGFTLISAADLTEFCPQTSTEFLVFVLQAQRKSILNHRHDDNSRNQDMVDRKSVV